MSILLGIDVDEILDWSQEKVMGYIHYLNAEHTDQWITSALICTTLVNLWSKKKVKLKDFLPSKSPSDAQIKASFKLLNKRKKNK